MTGWDVQSGGSFLTDQHHELRDRVRAFAETVLRPRVPELERARGVEVDLAREIARRGWIGVTIGPEFGGMGLGHVARTIVIEELARVCGAMGAVAQASILGVAKILHFGDEDQRRRWLPLVAAGRCLPTIAVTEHHSGGHVLGMSATARRDGDEYVLDGRKVFVGNSHIGDLHGVVVRTGPGANGLTAFLVEADRPGLRLGDHRPAMGLAGFSFGELVLEQCRVPVANRLGEEGDGLQVAYSSSVLYGRLNLAAVSLGIHRALLETTVEFVSDRDRGDGKLRDHPTVKQKIGAMRAALLTSEVLAYHASHLLDEGIPCDEHLMNAKLQNVELCLDSARTAMELHSAHGLYTDMQVERLVRDAFHIYAPAGTSDVQRLRLAEASWGGQRRHAEWSERFADELRGSSAALRPAVEGTARRRVPARAVRAPGAARARSLRGT